MKNTNYIQHVPYLRDSVASAIRQQKKLLKTIVRRGVKTPPFQKQPPILGNPPFLKIQEPPPPPPAFNIKFQVT